MSKENNKKQKEKISLTRAFTSDLKGRQSVRATFRLTQERLLPIIIKERTKHEKRKEFLIKIKKHFQQGEKMLKDIRKQLGDDDPIINKFAMIMSSYETVKDNMESFIDRSVGIEKFDADNMNH